MLFGVVQDIRHAEQFLRAVAVRIGEDFIVRVKLSVGLEDIAVADIAEELLHAVAEQCLESGRILVVFRIHPA